MNELKNYWRKELGTEFRNIALDYIAGYAETYGTIKENDDKTYVAELNVNHELSTIVPVSLACSSNTRDVRFVSMIKVCGKIKQDDDVIYKIKDEIKLIDNQNNEIDINKVCIYSILYLLDYLETKLDIEKKKEDV